MPIKSATRPKAAHPPQPVPHLAKADPVALRDTEPKTYLSTFQAAKILNLSVGTIQNLVEAKELQAWKTQGGHRRISSASVEAYKRHLFRGHGRLDVPAQGTLRVLFLDSDETWLRSIQKSLKKSTLALNCIYLSSGLEAMIQLPVQPPDVIFSEIELKDLDGADLLRKLHAATTIAKMGMVAWTSLDATALSARGCLPDPVVVLRKPLHTAWIEGYLSALSTPKR